MVKRKTGAGKPLALVTGPRAAEGAPPLQWATLATDMAGPLGQYLQATFGATLTPEQLAAFSSVIVGFVTPYAVSERDVALAAATAAFEEHVGALQGLRLQFEAAVRVNLRKIVSPLPCRIHEDSWCLRHHFEAPCPHGAAQAWLATQPED